MVFQPYHSRVPADPCFGDTHEIAETNDSPTRSVLWGWLPFVVAPRSRLNSPKYHNSTLVDAEHDAEHHLLYVLCYFNLP